jgi:two-component system, OmpR family, sensor kinase
MSRLPIRLRLTLAFTFVMALVLAATGLFLYVRLGNELDASLNAGLRSRADAVTALVQQAGSGLRNGGRSSLAPPDENYAQVVDENDAVIDSTAGLNEVPVLDPGQLERARLGTIVLDLGPPPNGDDPARVLATPVDAQGGRLVVVVGASRDGRAEALASLRTQLLVGGPIALLLASLAGYALAAAALRPVESMRRGAADISEASHGRRLPLSKPDDEIRRLGETLNEMLARLETALAREREFVADASHELRTPLALLKTELELAVRQPRTEEELQSALRSAVEEVDRLAQLAEDLLAIARSDRGTLPIRPAPLRVADLFADLVHRFEARATAAGRRIEVDDPGDLVLVADGLRLEQALGNLVDNALRHGSGTIRLAAIERDGQVETHVTDEGNGFPADFLAHAFERFSQADKSRRVGGAGLGLAISEVIARAHGGRAQAQNHAAGGADTWLSLPVEPRAA